jgi:hypothetical protein
MLPMSQVFGTCEEQTSVFSCWSLLFLEQMHIQSPLHGEVNAPCTFWVARNSYAILRVFLMLLWPSKGVMQKSQLCSQCRAGSLYFYRVGGEAAGYLVLCRFKTIKLFLAISAQRGGSTCPAPPSLAVHSRAPMLCCIALAVAVVCSMPCATLVVPEEDIALSSHSRLNLHIQRKLP